jgi:hypothetical protein
MPAIARKKRSSSTEGVPGGEGQVEYLKAAESGGGWTTSTSQGVEIFYDNPNGRVRMNRRIGELETEDDSYVYFPVFVRSRA